MMGLFLAISRVAFEIGPLKVHWYGLIIGVGMWLGYFIFKREGLRRGFLSDHLFDLFFWAMVNGLIGARLYYVLFNLDFFLQNWWEIPAIWHGGMAIYGGVIGGILTLYYYSRHYHLPHLELADCAAPGLMLAQAIGRWGNFINQEAHGQVVTRQFLESLHLPEWLIQQMHIQGQYYQPTFLYESVWNVIGVSLMLMLRRYWKSLRAGTLTSIYLIWYGLGRFWIEGMRTDSLYLGPIRISQLVSLIAIVSGIGLLSYVNRQKQS